MNRGDIKTELKEVLHDPSVEASFDVWLNEAIRELSYQFELPALRLKLPATLTTTTADWQYNISAATPPATGHAYQKLVYKITNSAHEFGMQVDRDVQIIDRLDPDHDDTGNDVDRVAVEDNTDDAVVAIYPKANDTLSLWYYRTPVDMDTDAKFPDGIPAAFHLRVLVPMVVLRAFRGYPDLATESEGDNTRALQLWQLRLNQGLYGDGFQIGMVPSLRKSRPLQVRGPRYGGSLAGADRFRGFRW